MRIITSHLRIRMLGGFLLLCVWAMGVSSGETAESSDAATGPFSRQAALGYQYEFPRDHGSHDEFRTEWWYYTGHLIAGNGRRFGYELTFFRRGVDSASARTNPSRWAVRHLYLAHFALSDHGKNTFRYAEKVSRAGLNKAGADTGRLHVWIDRWRAGSPAPGLLRHQLAASHEEFSIQLDLDPDKPPIVHGSNGVSRKGQRPSQTSHYYSLTRMTTTGTLTVNGERLSVTGVSWMDHEFGPGELGDDQTGWDWFSLQLNNRTEIMLYLLRRRDGTVDPASSGTIIQPDGQSQHLLLADIQAEPLDYWDSPLSGAHYPSRWRISIPRLGLLLAVVPIQTNQELMTNQSTHVTYWEGAVNISGTMQGASVAGQGYVELTGYAAPFDQR